MHLPKSLHHTSLYLNPPTPSPPPTHQQATPRPSPLTTARTTMSHTPLPPSTSTSPPPTPQTQTPTTAQKEPNCRSPAPTPPTRTTFLPGAHNLNSEFRVWFWEPWRRIRDRHRYSHSKDRGMLEVLSIVAPSGVGGYRIYHPWDKKSAIGEGVEGKGEGDGERNEGVGEGTAVGGRWGRVRGSDNNSSRRRKGNAGLDVLWQRYLEGSIVLNSASAYDSILPQLRSQPPQSCYLIACADS
ncbi:hypothetical protein DFP72DRAFT_225006 [Ephemerocybe angulata]|uniref:Uncharacterized protein n=1 Tax=Ephemerocybe angulata TaxID=980116 RepID=A0A8H6I4K1_9AGAR|nr:hypothetical protein DFP72DRAFT_225006 [Tulosesus angulatus]